LWRPTPPGIFADNNELSLRWNDRACPDFRCLNISPAGLLVGPSSGWFSAIDVSTGIFNWRKYLDLPANGGALVMDYRPPQSSEPNSSIVFTGLLDGRFGAYDGKSGNLLWQYATGAVIWAPPATFAENGDRYLLVASGGPGSMKVPELKDAIGPNVLTMFVSRAQKAD
jgi:glucose dehydrogenase